jgi:hypothetical protein
METSELMKFYLDTLSRCGLSVLDMDDEDIAYNIFEEFDIGAVTFLHENTLTELLNANLISKDVFDKSLMLRRKFFNLQNSDLRTIKAIKHNNKWIELFKLADEIKSMLQIKELEND